jgi:hypothetical protein
MGRENDSVILDRMGYSLDAPASMFGGDTRLTISSDVETSLADWIESTLNVLQPCWTATPPRQA